MVLGFVSRIQIIFQAQHNGFKSVAVLNHLSFPPLFPGIRILKNDAQINCSCSWFQFCLCVGSYESSVHISLSYIEIWTENGALCKMTFTESLLSLCYYLGLLLSRVEPSIFELNSSSSLLEGVQTQLEM